MKINNDYKPNETRKSNKPVKSPWRWVKRIIIAVVAVAVLGVGLGLIFNQQLMGAWVHHQTKPQAYMTVSKNEMKQNSKKEGNFDANSAVPVSPENLVKAALENKDRPVIGGVAIPALGINLPILLDDSDYNMLYGAGPLQPGQVMGEGNYTLASHDMWTNRSYYSQSLLFSPLVRAEIGQKIYLTDKDKVYEYEIYDKRKVLPEAWNDAVDDIPGKKVVTLITCDTNDEYRILVRGDLKAVHEFNDDTAKPFTEDLNIYQG